MQSANARALASNAISESRTWIANVSKTSHDSPHATMAIDPSEVPIGAGARASPSVTPILIRPPNGAPQAGLMEFEVI